MSENRKDELNTHLSKLTADRDVLRWKALQPSSPTIENYETHSKEHKQEKYVTNEKNFALDDIVNGHGNGSLVEGTDEWYAAHKKVSDLDNQLRALSMGKMGQLDGERAVSAEEQASAEKDEEERLQEDIAYNQTLTAKLPADESLTESERREIDEQITADIAYNDAMQASQFDTQLDAEKQAEKDAAITQLDTQMAEEIAVASDLRTDAYNRGYGYFDLEYKDKNRQAFEGQIRFALGIDASGFTKDELREAFAQSTWALDDAYDISIDEFVEDITAKYGGMKEEALGKIDDKYFALERIGEMEENPEFSFVDWYSEDFDMNVRMQGYEQERIDLLTLYNHKKTEEKDNDSWSHDEWVEQNKELHDEMKAIESRIAQIDKIMEDTKIALNGNMEDMNLSQLTIWAENEFQNSFKELEQGIINDSLNYFNTAIDEWIAGNDTEIVRIVAEMSGGLMNLDDIDDFNQLRAEYVQGHWESLTIDDSLAQGYEQNFNYICAEIEPYFKRAANYEETDNGYTFEMTPELAGYAKQYAEAKEQAEKEKGIMTTVSGSAGGSGIGFAVGTVLAGPLGGLAGSAIGTVVGAMFGAIFTVFGLNVRKKEDEWDDIAQQMLTFNITDKTLIIEYNSKEGDVVDIIEKEE